MAVISIKNKTKSGSLLVGNTPYDPTPPATILAIAFGSTNSATSEDSGTTWTLRSMPSSQNWYALRYDAGKFFAAGNGSTTAAYSTDGITWTTTTLPASKAWSQTAYGNSTWVVNGQNDPSYLAYSSNLTSWSNSSAGGSGVAGAGVAFGAGVFVVPDTAGNAGTNAYYSSNGTSWTNGGSMGATTGWGRIYYGANGGFIVTNNLNSNYVSQSSTGTGSWTLRTLPATRAWGSCLAYGNGTWSYLSGGSTQGAYSTNGTTWSSMTGPSTAAWQSMWYSTARGKFIAVAGASNSIAISSTGTGSWTLGTLPATGDWYSISSNA